LSIKYDGPLSNVAFNGNLRHYNKGGGYEKLQITFVGVTLCPGGEDHITIKYPGHHNKLCAPIGADGVVNCNSDVSADASKFKIKLDDAAALEKWYNLADGIDGKFCADDDTDFKCNRPSPGDWEKFRFSVVADKFLMLGSHHNKYCKVGRCRLTLGFCS